MNLCYSEIQIETQVKASYDYMLDLSLKSDCMKESVQQLEQKCKFISSKEKRNLAFSFYQCHFKQSGRDPIECLWKEDVSECTKYLSNDHWNSYSMFHQHIDNLCIYYQNSNWQYDTLIIVDQLKQYSIKSAEKISQNIQIMNDLYNIQQKMDQKLKLSYQQSQQANNEILNQYLKIESKNHDFQQTFDSMQNKIKQQQENSYQFFTKIISRLDYFTYLQESYLIDFGGTLYYLALGIILYTLTNYKLFKEVLKFHQKKARGSITILLVLNIFLEQFVNSTTFKNIMFMIFQENQLNFIKLEIQYSIRFLVNIIILRLIYTSAINYKDHRKLNTINFEKILIKLDTICNSKKLEKVIKDSLNSIFDSLKKQMKFMTPKTINSNLKKKLITPKLLSFQQQEIPEMTQ